MADAFLRLPIAGRRKALSVAAAKPGRPAHLLEKNAWVVRALATKRCAGIAIRTNGTAI